MNRKALIGFVLFFVFFCVFPLCELLFVELFGGNVDYVSLFLFVVYQFVSVAFAVFLYSFFRRQPCGYIDYNYRNEVVFGRVNLFFCVVFFLFFAVFLMRNIAGLADILLFSERYRNGYYKGSGIYTAVLTIFMPLSLSVMIIMFKRLTLSFYLSLFIVLATCFFLGLRIFLIGVIFFLMARMLSTGFRWRNIFFAFLVVVLFVSFKVILATEPGLGIVDVFLKVVGRISYRYLVFDSGYMYSFSELLGFLPRIQDGFDNFSTWKEFYTKSIPHIDSNMPQIGLYSGMAFPVSLIIFNGMGFFGFLINSLLIFLFLRAMDFLYRKQSLYSIVVCSYFVYFLLYLLIEDVNSIVMFPIMFIVVQILFIYFWVFSFKINFKKSIKEFL